MPEKQRTYQRHDDEFQNEFEAQVLDRTINQLTAVIGRDDFDPLRDAGLKLIKFALDCRDGFTCVLAATQDNNSSHHLTFAIKLGYPATHLWAELDMCYVPQGHRDAAVDAQGDDSKVAQSLQISRRTHHEFRFRELQDTTTRLPVRLVTCLDDLLLCHPSAGHAHRIQHHLVSFDHSAYGRYFRPSPGWPRQLLGLSTAESPLCWPCAPDPAPPGIV